VHSSFRPDRTRFRLRTSAGSRLPPARRAELDVAVRPPPRQIRAAFDDTTLTVYQAYSPQIADAALKARTFVPPFKLTRMTWIKPSFLWMMYRSGWATKPGQERILAVRITREGFEEALRGACLSHFDPSAYADHAAWQQRKRISAVRVQWDPERTVDLRPLPWRTIQIGLAGPAIRKYVAEWIIDITDITDLSKACRHEPARIGALVAREEPYPLAREIAKNIGASVT
jgi:hypothetical protein